MRRVLALLSVVALIFAASATTRAASNDGDDKPYFLAFLLDQLECQMSPLGAWCLLRAMNKEIRTLDDKRADPIWAYMHAALFQTQRWIKSKYTLRGHGLRNLKRIKRVPYRWVVRATNKAYRKDFAGALEAVRRVKFLTPRITALLHLAEAQIRAGKKSDAADAASRAVKLALRLKRPPARLVPLATAAWLQARAGDRASAKDTIAKCAEIIAGHPSAEARAVMGMELAAARSLAGDKGGAVRRLAEGLASLNRAKRLPPFLKANAYAVAAKNYGRMGMAKEAAATGGTALRLAKALAVRERLLVMRNLVEARLKH